MRSFLGTTGGIQSGRERRDAGQVKQQSFGRSRWIMFVIICHARLQVFVCSGHNLCHPGWRPDIHTDRQHLTSLY